MKQVPLEVKKMTIVFNYNLLSHQNQSISRLLVVFWMFHFNKLNNDVRVWKPSHVRKSQKN